MTSRPTLRDLHWVYPAWSAFLGALGGWHWTWLRRGLLPASGAILAWAYGIKPWKAILYGIATGVVYSLPYSPERQNWAFVVLVGAFYGMTPWLLTFKKRWLWWPLLTGGVLAGLLLVSAHVPWWTHKFTEMAVFFVQGFLTAYAIDKRDQ